MNIFGKIIKQSVNCAKTLRDVFLVQLTFIFDKLLALCGEREKFFKNVENRTEKEMKNN